MLTIEDIKDEYKIKLVFDNKDLAKGFVEKYFTQKEDVREYNWKTKKWNYVTRE